MLSFKYFITGEQKAGLFCRMGSSRLCHPSPWSLRDPSSGWTLKHYELAGKVVGKCLWETAKGGFHKQMVNARLSRSFLGQIIGFPPHYKVVVSHYRNTLITFKTLAFNLLKKFLIFCFSVFRARRSRAVYDEDQVPPGKRRWCNGPQLHGGRVQCKWTATKGSLKFRKFYYLLTF